MADADASVPLLDQIPNEILCEILMHLTPCDLAQFAQTHRRGSSIAWSSVRAIDFLPAHWGDAHVTRCRSLTSLRIGFFGEEVDIWLASFSRLAQLKQEFSISIPSMITDAGLGILVNLTQLNLGRNTNITDAGLGTLVKLTQLDLGWNKNITDAGLGTLVNLTQLDLGRNKNITDARLRTLVNLTQLDLGRNKCITNAGLGTLVSLTKLNLDFNKNITDEGLVPLAHLTRLEIGQNLNMVKLMTNPQARMSHIQFARTICIPDVFEG